MFVFIAVAPLLASASNIFSNEVLRKTEKSLQKQCGAKCVTTFHNLIPDLERVMKASQSISWRKRGGSEGEREEVGVLSVLF